MDLLYFVEVLTKFLEHPITSVLKAASDRLLISIFFSAFSTVFLFLHLGHVSLSPCFGSLLVFVSVY